MFNNLSRIHLGFCCYWPLFACTAALFCGWIQDFIVPPICCRLNSRWNLTTFPLDDICCYFICQFCLLAFLTTSVFVSKPDNKNKQNLNNDLKLWPRTRPVRPRVLSPEEATLFQGALCSRGPGGMAHCALLHVMVSVFVSGGRPRLLWLCSCENGARESYRFHINYKHTFEKMTPFKWCLLL